MAGGGGSKERRRMKRLQAATKGKEHQDGTDNNPKQKNQKNKAVAASSKKPSFSKPVIRRTKAAATTQTKKPKVKKPKHLKRKLEQAAQEDDQMKQKLQKELEEFERKKELLSRKNKRQRTANNVKTQNASSSMPGTATKSAETKKETRAMEGNEERDSTASSSSDGQSSADLNSEMQTETIETVKKESTATPKYREKTKRDAADKDSDNDDSDDESDVEEPTLQRQRGRRRRGRKDTSKKIEETKSAEKEKEVSTTKSDTAVSSQDKDAISPSSKESSETNNEPAKKRYCIGRKPVTDFELGQSYSGTVVYVKPFGVFFDIGCHSDAFCHVSRLSDDFVESPESLFKEGDKVSKMRVVEIDRKQKRITVSLQSEARLKDELASIEARKQRKELRKAKSGRKKGRPLQHPEGKLLAADEEKGNENKSPQKVNKPTAEKVKPPSREAPPSEDPSMMSPAELKRARKLARRAARREQAAEQPGQ